MCKFEGKGSKYHMAHPRRICISVSLNIRSYSATTAQNPEYKLTIWYSRRGERKMHRPPRADIKLIESDQENVLLDSTLVETLKETRALCSDIQTSPPPASISITVTYLC